MGWLDIPAQVFVLLTDVPCERPMRSSSRVFKYGCNSVLAYSSFFVWLAIYFGALQSWLSYCGNTRLLGPQYGAIIKSKVKYCEASYRSRLAKSRENSAYVVGRHDTRKMA